MILTVHEWEQTIFTVQEQEWMILLCAHFQDLMRNDQEMIKNEREISFMTINDWYNPFSFAVHELWVTRFF